MKEVRGFILMPVVLLLGLIAAMALLGQRETALGSAMSMAPLDQAKARLAAEAGLQRATLAMHNKGCSGTYPNLFSPVKDTAFDGASYTAIANRLSGTDVTVYSTGTYGTASVTLTRKNIPMHLSSSVTMNLQPVSAGLDTYLNSPATSGNAGKTTLVANPGTSYPLLGFDLSKLPAGAHVSAATLSLYASGGSGNGVVSVHRVTRDWSTSNASWTNADSSTAWTTAGGDVHATALASATFSGAPTTLSWDVTGLVDRWLKGSLPNQGVQLRASSGLSGLNLVSSEGSTQSQRPKLSVTFQAPCDWVLPATVVTLAAIADTDLNSALPLLNTGTAATTAVSSLLGGRTVNAFDVSGVPVGSTVSSAKLRVYLASNSLTTASTALTLEAHALTQSWTEAGANWLLSALLSPWLPLGGGTFRPAAAGSAVLAKGAAAGQWVEMEIGPLVQEWVDGVTPNYGVALINATSALDLLRFNSRESSSNAPQLVVTYY